MQICSWSANRSLKGDFTPRVLLRLSNYSRLDQTGVSVQRRSALRTITGSVAVISLAGLAFFFHF